jgi:hypothetical protein
MVIAHTQEPPPDVTEDNPDLPPAFSTIIERALAKDPADRYATAAEMAAAVDDALRGKVPGAVVTTPVAAAMTGEPPPPSPPSSDAGPVAGEGAGRPPWALAAIGLAVVAILIVVGLLAAGVFESSADDSAGDTELVVLPTATETGSPTAMPVPPTATPTLTATPAPTEPAPTATEVLADTPGSADPTPTETATATPSPTNTPAPITISFQRNARPDVTYDGVADATISQWAPNINDGDNATCRVDGDDPSSTGNDLITLVSWDVSLIPPNSQGWVDDPESNHGFVITGTNSRDGVDFRCSEYESPLERPLLTITYIPSGQ